MEYNIKKIDCWILLIDGGKNAGNVAQFVNFEREFSENLNSMSVGLVSHSAE